MNGIDQLVELQSNMGECQLICQTRLGMCVTVSPSILFVLLLLLSGGPMPPRVGRSSGRKRR